MAKRSLSLRNLLIFVSVALGSSTALSRLPVYPPGNREAFAEFEDTKHEYDVLFFGSSYTTRGIMPHAFDARMAELGRPVRSFNLGMGGAGGYEIDRTLRWALGLSPERLKLVIIEPRPWHRGRGSLTSQRRVWWHTPLETRLAIVSILDSEDPFTAKAGQVLAELKWGTMHAFGLGLFALRVDESPEKPKIAGWQPYQEFFREGPVNPQAFAQHLQRFDDFEKTGDFGNYNLNALKTQRSFLEGRGIGFVYLFPPTGMTIPRLTALGSKGLLDPLLNLNDPHKFPNLFEVEHRQNLTHLTPIGAREYTRELATTALPYLNL